MYVVPYVMGPARLAHVEGRRRADRQLYVVLNMRIMTRMGTRRAADARRLERLQPRPALDARHATRSAASSATSRRTTRSGASASGYGGNVLLGKKCLALRIGSYLGQTRGLARRAHAHPRRRVARGRDDVRRRRVPERVRQDELRHDDPAQALQGLEDLDRRRRHRLDARRRATAASTPSTPRPATSASRPGTNATDQPERDEDHVARHDLHQRRHDARTATSGGRARTARSPTSSPTGRASPWKKGSTEKAAHPNSRFTAPATNNPALSKFADDPEGVPISAIIFGGRRATTVPLVMQAFNWMHGVFFGATLGQRDDRGGRRARSASCAATRWRCCPFCGYNMGDYFAHWLDMQAQDRSTRRRSSWSTGSGRSKDGKFLWPGYGENMRVLKWIVDRARLRVGGQETPFGWVPKAGDLDLSGLDIPHEQVDEATHIDLDEWTDRARVDRRVLQDARDRACPRCSIFTARSRWSASRSCVRPRARSEGGARDRVRRAAS